MCAPGCIEAVRARLTRRGFFSAGGAALAAAPIVAVSRPAVARSIAHSKTIDLTHTLSADFPTFGGAPTFASEATWLYSDGGWNQLKWTLEEHTGTHMDAPFHCSENGATADVIPADQLVVPLAVVDVRAAADADADYRLTPDDLKAYEAAHGPLPEGGAVAMLSGWEKHLGTDKFRNADAAGVMHFPGFHVEAAQMMIEKNIVGMVVDTLSLDHGASTDFPTHLLWLPSGRWGLENTANLAEVPPAGATIVVGGPKIKGASGGPTRAFALI